MRDRNTSRPILEPTDDTSDVVHYLIQRIGALGTVMKRHPARFDAYKNARAIRGELYAMLTMLDPKAAKDLGPEL